MTHQSTRLLGFVLAAATLIVSAVLAPTDEPLAQGCILIRNNAPIFGASDTLPFRAHEWQFNFNYRGLVADDHYSGTQFQYQRKALNNYVINTQQSYDFGVTYSVTERFNLSLSVPIINASWSIPLPAQPPLGPRSEQNAAGLGDVIFGGRYWMLKPEKHPTANFSLGLGVKFPSGNAYVKDTYPILNGTNPTVKAVDQSIQPGDNGWGVVFDIQGYKSIKHISFFGSGTYLINPTDTNYTPSIIVGLGLGANPAFSDLLVNSITDSYMARAGAVFQFPAKWFQMSFGFRIEGLPRYDLIGDSHGWRRPGYETFMEPGFIFVTGPSTFTLYVPIGLVQNRLPNPYTGNSGDATFPEYIILGGYSYRFPPKGSKAS